MIKKIFLIFTIIFIVSLIYFSFKTYINSYNNEYSIGIEKPENIKNENDIDLAMNNCEENINIENTTNNLTENVNNSITDDDIILNISGSACFAYDLSDSKIRNDYSDYIIVGKVTSIDGGTNYNSAVNEYTIISTIGEIEVQKVIKGDISDEKIPFIRVGGKIDVKQYEDGLLESEKLKLSSILNQLNDEEKKCKYVKQKFQEDIDIEEGKLYLMYLKYNKDYERYSILFMEYGLNELQIQNNTKTTNVNSLNETSLDNMMIKDNKTGKYLSISNYIGNIE